MLEEVNLKKNRAYNELPSGLKEVVDYIYDNNYDVRLNIDSFYAEKHGMVYHVYINESIRVGMEIGPGLYTRVYGDCMLFDGVKELFEHIDDYIK